MSLQQWKDRLTWIFRRRRLTANWTTRSIGANDPVTLLGGCLVLCIVATLAALIPAVRATRIEPQIVLRSE